MKVYYSKNVQEYGEMNYEGKYLIDPKYMTKRDLRHYYRYYNMTKNRSQFKKIIIIIFCICFFSYIFIDYNLKTKIIQLRDRFDFIARVDDNHNTTQAYFVNTPGCRIPYFAAIDDNTIQFMSRPEKIACKKSLTRTSDIGATMIINMKEKEILHHYNLTNLSSTYCYYREIKRKTDFENIYGQHIVFKLEVNSSVNIPPGIEFIEVECKNSKNRTFYHDFHFFVLNKHNVSSDVTTKKPSSFNIPEENESSKSKYKTHWRHLSPRMLKATATIPDEPDERVSVMLLGIDSVSHLNFLRQMQRTAAFIHQNLTHVEFWGYNKVANNTLPNLMPVLSGLDVAELNIACLDPVKRDNLDKCHFIWKRYKEAGYQTVFAEDMSALGLFKNGLPGFKIQPTDYYLPTILVDMERYIGNKTVSDMKLCMGGRRSADVVLEFIRKLIPYLKIQDFFSIFWTTTLTQKYFNSPILLDKDLTHIFNLFNEAGIFNKTVIFFMSDHGIHSGSFRETYQGMMEERQPLLIALIPSWFRQKYTAAIRNMELNAKRLTTHFDLHATLLDLLDLHSLDESKLQLRASNIAEADTLPRGISLFLPIPITRTCDNAGLTSHWCLCHHREELPTNDARVQRAARYVIKLINERLKMHPQCRVLYLNSILDAEIAAPHQKIVKDVTNDYSIDITMRIQAKPGLGQYESTVRMSVYTIELTSGISRINLYGSQSYCIDVQELKMFCYCHR